ncbi:MAG: TlpA family protein disulfide reductase, partial [Candidatus Heimdallarchaeaceae archaeon]
DMIQIISVDIDNTESDALVSGFRDNWDMFWIVGIDYDEAIYQKYGTGYVPTFHMVDQAGDIVWSHIGSDMMPDVLDELKKLLPDDTTDPIIHEYTAKKDGSEFSIYETTVDIYANLSDDRWVNGAELIVETSDETLSFELEVEEKGDYFEVLETIELSPTNLFGETNVNFTLEAKDMWNNTMLSTVKTIDVTEYIDTEDPTIGNVGVEIVEVDTARYTAYVYAAISDDIMVWDAKVKLIDENETVIRTKEFTPFNATHMKATLANLLYVDGHPYEYTIEIIVTDIDGRTTKVSVNLADEPIPEETNAALVVSLIALLTFGSLVFRRKRR